MHQAIENTATMQLEGELGEIRSGKIYRCFTANSAWKQLQALSSTTKDLVKNCIQII